VWKLSVSLVGQKENKNKEATNKSTAAEKK
jgi:hypothetical protein